MTFKPGDLVEVVTSMDKRHIGDQLTVASHPYAYDCVRGQFAGTVQMSVGVEPNEEGHTACNVKCLQFIPPPNTLSTWEDMADIWQPKELVIA